MCRHLHLLTLTETDTPEGLASFTAWLRDNPGEVDARDSRGSTLLGLATQLNRIELMQVLLEVGADPNGLRNTGDFVRLLSLARTPEAATLLLEAGANVEGEPPVSWGQGEISRHTPLGVASASGNRAVVQLLLASGADVNRRQSDDEAPLTPLLIALEEGRTEIARDLIDAGASIGLFEAVLIGNAATVRQLLESLAERDSLSPDLLYDALWWAAGIRPSTDSTAEGAREVIALLIANGANPNVPFHQRIGRNFGPLFRAAWSNPVCVEVLLAHDADPTLRDGSGQTALHFANTEHTVRSLLAAGAEVDAVDDSGMTPLHSAMRFTSPGIARILIDHGADVNRIDKFHHSPLIHAINTGEPEVVQLLLEAGANVDVRDDQVKIAPSLAEKYGYPEVARLLREAQEKAKRQA